MKNKNHYFLWGVTALSVILLSIVFAFTLANLRSVIGALRSFIGILMPFIWGFAIAYLLLPVFNFNMRLIEPRMLKNAKDRVKAKGRARMTASIFTVLEGCLVVGGLLSLVLPQLVISVYSLIGSMEEYGIQIQAFVNEILESNFLKSNPVLESNVLNVYNELSEFFTGFVSDFVFPRLISLMSSFMSTVSAVKDFLIGMIIVIYVLCSKDLFCAQSKKIIYAVLPIKKANLVVDNLRFTHRVFGGFISGKLLDSLIIGVICFVVMSILRMPYVVLISVIIGVTNIIPFFGPFIGAVPSALLVLMVDPLQCVYFVIFVLILQQFDGNILGPKILGDSTGLSAFWVMFAILVFGGVFGFVGMLVGVPLFAVMYALVTGLVNRSLRAKHLPENTNDYYDLGEIDPLTLECRPIERKSGAGKK